MNKEKKELVFGTELTQREMNRITGLTLLLASIMPIGYAYAYGLKWGYLIGAIMLVFGFGILRGWGENPK